MKFSFIHEFGCNISSLGDASLQHRDLHVTLVTAKQSQDWSLWALEVGLKAQLSLLHF
jgi:hypothetical protein